jgi:hypothetical protein
MRQIPRSVFQDGSEPRSKKKLGKYPCGIQNHQEPLTHTKRCVSIVTTIQIHSGFRVETNIKTLITYKICKFD